MRALLLSDTRVKCLHCLSKYGSNQNSLKMPSWIWENFNNCIVPIQSTNVLSPVEVQSSAIISGNG